jgi:NTE family protein
MTSPRIGLALGAGGARGMAHITVLSALDELGLKPTLISGSSIGAVIGAAYAAGMNGRDLAETTRRMFHNRAEVLARLLKARVGRLGDLLARGGNPVLVDGERLLDLFWPDAVPDHFSDLKIPFLAIATDFNARRSIAFETGPLVSAVAASMAIPGLVKPVSIAGNIYIDGGAADPLPYETLTGRADLIIAVDVATGPARDLSDGPPDALRTALGAAQIMQSVIVMAKLERRSPDLLLCPPVEDFRTLDFMNADAILTRADAAKDDIKRQVDALLSTPR